MTTNQKLTFNEFFAGGGMARAGLGKDWQCLFANDFDKKKAKHTNEIGEMITIFSLAMFGM
jgi:site-specific DNA-cytosine methylase